MDKKYLGLCGYERANFFKKYIGEGKKILDIGCGAGEIAQFYSKNNQITGIDFNQNKKEQFVERTGGGIYSCRY
jgi:ubiquinone/menaquinone biosynthesis C-methylase UbiE